MKMNMIQFASIYHPETCYRNTNIDPACAKEFACVKAVDRLLCDGNGNFLPDDQAIFADRLVTNGDTRGSLKFIAKQNELIGGVSDGIAKHVPDIGHFIKTVSNGLYTFKQKNKS